jgi:hypothetical protein
MRDVDRALSDIRAIQDQVARTVVFRGFGPEVLAATGLLAVAWGTLQWFWLADGALSQQRFVLQWVGIAVIASLMLGVEAVRRARAMHGAQGDRLTLAMARGLVPVGITGALLTAVLFFAAQDTLWLLPGLWQILLGVALFAIAGSLPPGMRLVAGWYVATGLSCLAFTGGAPTPSPWSMAVPFGIGQLLAAYLHYRGSQDHG